MSKQPTREREPGTGRRGFLGYAWLGAMIVLLGECLGAVVRYLKPVGSDGFGGVVHAGAVDDFPPGSVSTVKAGRFHLVRFENGSFLALWQRCTHLGCAVPWVESEGEFHCPCHGSLFDRKGEVTGGLATRPLDLFPVTIEDGQVYVDTANPITRSAFDPSQATPA